MLRSAGVLLILAGLATGGYGAFIPAKAMVAQVLLDAAWARARTGTREPRPWPWADIVPVAEIDVPRLGRRLIVLGGTSGEALAFGPGHMTASAPIGGPGTAVIAGHRDTHFRFLAALAPGDVIDARTADGIATRYRVIGSAVVPAAASGLDPADGGATGGRLALVTCYPFDGVLGSPWRYVVLAERERTFARPGGLMKSSASPGTRGTG